MPTSPSLVMARSVSLTAASTSWKGHQSHALEPRTLRANRSDPVVVAAAKGRRVVFFRQLGHAESAGGKKHGHVDLLLVHVAQPRRHVRNVHAELAVHAGIPDVVRKQRSLAPAVGLFHKLSNVGVAVSDMAVGIDDFYVGQVWVHVHALLGLSISRATERLPPSGAYANV